MDTKINDIIHLKDWKSLVIDATVFFPKFNLSVIKLNQNKLFSDIYNDLQDNIDLRLVKYLKINKLRNNETKDIIKKNPTKSSFSNISNLILGKKERILINPISIIEPLDKQPRNSLDIRDLQFLPSFKTYPDLFILPLPPVKKARKFYRKNKIQIITGFSKWTKWAILASVIVLSLIFFWIWYKNYLQNEVETTYKRINWLRTVKDPNFLKTEAIILNSKFKTLKILFFPVNLILNNHFYQNKLVVKVDNIISWWKEITSIAIQWAYIWKDFEDEKNTISKKLKLDKINNIEALKKIELTNFLEKENDKINLISSHLDSTINYYSQIDTLWNKDLDDKFQSGLENLIKLKKYINFYIKNKEYIFNFAWDTKPVRYLILNQNKDEIRANGGFPWSVITLELYKWSILNYDKKDVYYYDWHITPYMETPPEWLSIISPNHGLRDANYMPLFRESIEKINFFYEKGGWWTINTVIGINQWLIEDFLKKYWNIHLDEINKDVTADNFSLIMSALVENKFWKITSPKDILFKFTENFEKRLIEKKDYLGYIDIVMNNLLSWDISVASLDKDSQKYIDSFNIFDKWLKDEGNWIYPVFTSISWNKSDRYMRREFSLIPLSFSGCEVTNHFRLESYNEFNVNIKKEILWLFDELKIKDPEERARLLQIQGEWTNRQFIRILAPKWSKITNKFNYMVSQDDSHPDYTFFKFYLNTDISKKSLIEFEYSTKPKKCDSKPVFYKQPGLGIYWFND